MRFPHVNQGLKDLALFLKSKIFYIDMHRYQNAVKCRITKCKEIHEITAFSDLLLIL